METYTWGPYDRGVYQHEREIEFEAMDDSIALLRVLGLGSGVLSCGDRQVAIF